MPLEHVFHLFTAFRNLCRMSRDAVMVVAAFLQEQHGDYGETWRFTPWSLKRLFAANGLTPAYLAHSDGRGAIHVVGAGTRKESTIAGLRQLESNGVDGAGRLKIVRGLTRKS
jgi:hypothetical protein